jgi:secondary thiamine-phosphate synthase enzyme
MDPQASSLFFCAPWVSWASQDRTAGISLCLPVKKGVVVVTMVTPGDHVQASLSLSGTLTCCTSILHIQTTHGPEMIDITDQVEAAVRASRVVEGSVLIYSRHTTAAIKINEHEPLLLEDIEAFLRQLCPQDGSFNHNDFSRRTVNMEVDECPNAHAHCLHLLLSTSETVPISNGQMLLGNWQRIFLVELDHERPREIVVQVSGQRASFPQPEQGNGHRPSHSLIS